MDWIGFVLNSPFLVSNDTAKDTSLLERWSLWADQDGLTNVVGFQYFFAPCQFVIFCNENEIISMYQAINVASWMIEMAWRGGTFQEASIN